MTVLAAFLVLAAHAAEPPVMPNPNFIVLIDQLDEAVDNDFYCADVAGDIVEAGKPLQAHTCKEPNNDELFETNAPFEGMIYVSDHRLCLGMDSVVPGNPIVMLMECVQTDTNQIWVSSAGGQIHPASDTNLCWTVGEDAGIPSGAGGDHMNKTLTLERCADHDAKYTSFHMGRDFVGPPPKP